MSFNVNFLGGIPYNPDNLHIPPNDKKGVPNIFPAIPSTRLLGYSFNQMFKAYWTVRSFKVTVTASVIDTSDPFSQFILGGGTSAGIVGATAGLASINAPKDGSISAAGYTKIYSKSSKRVRKAREGILNNKTQADVNKENPLDLDEDIDPNKLQSFIYGTNEGTLCSAGPVHIFSTNNVTIILDFSDIKYYAYRRTRLYWPNTTIDIAVPTAGATFSNIRRGNVLLDGNIGITNSALSFVNLNVPDTLANLSSLYLTSATYSTQIANVNIDIRPGKRCCDRFLWDGKDNERQKDSETKTPNEDSEESCEDVCGYDEEHGVYAKKIEKL